MKKFRITSLMIFTMIFFAGCTATTSIMTDYDREADFSEYRTFFWSDEFQMRNNEDGNNEPLFYNTLNKKRLKQAIQREMEGRGYTLSSEDPDLLVNAQVIVEERSNNQNFYPAFYPYYYGGLNTPNPQTNKEGDIVIDLIDQREHQLVWQGYATSVLDIRTKNKEEEIREAVTLIFAKYGRRAGQNSSPEQ